VDAQHGPDAALVVQHQPTQGLLSCRDNHPLDAASRRRQPLGRCQET
jgi:hypothetical protein